MFTKRIIPCLDVNNNRVVKGTNFVNLKDAGDPVEVAKAYTKVVSTFFTALSRSYPKSRSSKSVTSLRILLRW